MVQGLGLLLFDWLLFSYYFGPIKNIVLLTTFFILKFWRAYHIFL